MPSRRPDSHNPFSLRGKVDRGEYLLVGLVLMLLKYGVEAGTILAATGLIYTPFDFLNPWLSSREHFANNAAPWLGVAWFVWTVPFVWIAVAMTLRRAVDAGITPWVSLLILVPFVNFATMISLAFFRSVSTDAQKADAAAAEVQLREAWAAPREELLQQAPGDPGLETSATVAALAGLAVGVFYTINLMILSVYGFGSYGSALFFGAPIVTGASTAYIFNRPRPHGVLATLGLSLLVVACCCGAFLLIGLEGLICIFMAAPILAPLTLFGALVGRGIALSFGSNFERDDRGMLGCLIVLPLLAGVEPIVFEPACRSVATSIEIDAPPEEVWRMVTAFPEITAEPEWYFRWGIAAPLRARIDGEGVGATRHCEFTTGAFVEPITVWDAPRRLAFDVTEQPEPMFELTPYRHLHPPHLTGSFRSTQGEFLLEPTETGGTRLIGTTWYTLDLAPHGYWQVWTDAIVHRIHLRVLRHIREAVENVEEDTR